MKHLALVLVIALLFNGCAGAISNEEQINARGNTVGNIVNGGFVAHQGDWIYYSIYLEDKLYKKHIDGTQRKLIADDRAGYINVVGDWIYYLNYNEDQMNLVKISTEGTQRTILSNDASLYISVVDDWIYYVNHSSNQEVYRIRTDGTDKQRITEDSAKSINVVDDWIYFINLDDYRSLYKVKVDGTIQEKIGNSFGDVFIIVQDDWIYFNNMSNKGVGTLYRICTDGTEQTVIHEGKTSIFTFFNLKDDWIYFADEINLGLYKIQSDRTGLANLLDEYIFSINIIGDWIYYIGNMDGEFGDNAKLFRIRTDGTDRQLVE